MDGKTCPNPTAIHRRSPRIVPGMCPKTITFTCTNQKALFNDRGYENAKSFASRLLAYSLWLMVRLRQLQAISLYFPTSGAKAISVLVKHKPIKMAGAICLWQIRPAARLCCAYAAPTNRASDPRRFYRWHNAIRQLPVLRCADHASRLPG